MLGLRRRGRGRRLWSQSACGSAWLRLGQQLLKGKMRALARGAELCGAGDFAHVVAHAASTGSPRPAPCSPVAAGSEQGPATAALLADSPCFSLQGTLEGLEEELLAFFSVTPHSVYTALMDNRYFPSSGSVGCHRSRPTEQGLVGAGVPSHARPTCGGSQLTTAMRAGCSAWVPCAPACAPEPPQAAEGLWERRRPLGLPSARLGSPSGDVRLARPLRSRQGRDALGGSLHRDLWHFVLPVSDPWVHGRNEGRATLGRCWSETRRL